MRKIDKTTGRWIEEPSMAMKPAAKKPKAKKTKPPTKKPKTYIVMILDKSGSMASCKDKALGHFNEQVEEIQQASKEQDISVSLVMFNNRLQYKYFNAKLEKLQTLKSRDYDPAGMTALNDAIGCTIDLMKTEFSDLGEDHVSVLFYIITDGYENASMTYRSREEIATRIKNLQSSGRWTFTYMGTEHNVEKVALAYSIPINNTLRFDKKEFKTATEITRTATNDYFKSRLLGQLSTEQFYDKKI